MDDAAIVGLLEREEIEESDIFCTIDEEIIIPAGCSDLSSILNYAKFKISITNG